MTVKFDALTPVPSPEALSEARRRSQERLDRQARANAVRREQLLDVAQAVIESQGLEGFNMRVIARQAGYTAGALYAYFDGKEGILLALQRRVLDRLADAVRAVKPPRPARSARMLAMPGDDAGSVSFGGLGPAQVLYLAQSLAWWRSLALDPGGFQLLLLRPALVAASGAQATQETPLAGAAAVLGDLEGLLQPCRDSLLACGLSEGAAYELHRELVACGLGLLALATASGHSHLDGLEAQWRGTLQRWLAQSLAPLARPADAHGAGDQGDLFVG
jgi:AcrR family transcriptional regulator